MTVIDSCGWVEVFTGGTLAQDYRRHLDSPEETLVPTVVLYEVYKIICREMSENAAMLAAARMRDDMLVPLDDPLALQAADLSLEHGLSMADAIVYATAQTHDALLVTSDAHFADLPGVEYLEKEDSDE